MIDWIVNCTNEKNLLNSTNDIQKLKKTKTDWFPFCRLKLSGSQNSVSLWAADGIGMDVSLDTMSRNNSLSY